MASMPRLGGRGLSAQDRGAWPPCPGPGGVASLLPAVGQPGGNQGLGQCLSRSPSAEAGLRDTMAAKQPPPLMKKHSQTDLVSRLKTRKILGVGGEDDDGEVHRSKVGLQPCPHAQGPLSAKPGKGRWGP